MKWYKKIIIGLAAVVVLLVLVNIGLNIWVSKRLPHIINEANDSPYHITYKDIDVSLMTRHIKAREIIVVPKASMVSAKSKAGIYGKIESIEIAGIDLWDLLTSDRIKASKLIVYKPKATYIREKDSNVKQKKVIRSEVVEPFSKIIYVSDIFVKDGDFQMTDLDKTKTFHAHHVELQIEKIAITDETLERKLPFAYGKYVFNCDSLFYIPNANYSIHAKNIRSTHNSLKIDSFKLAPRLGRRAFVANLKTEKDQYAVLGKSIESKNLKWGYKGKDLYVHSEHVMLDGVDANIYRSKIPPDDMTKKKLFSRMLRELDFEMKVDTFRMKDSRLVYEEELDVAKGPGILTFNNFNVWATNVRSGFGVKTLPDLKIKIKCRFMNSAPLDVDWSFNVMNTSDKFNIRGKIFNFPAERLIPFTKPYINAEVKGDLDEVYFNFTGNDVNAVGDFAINYDDLKVSVFKKKDPKKKRKFLSSLLNLFVKNDTREKVTGAEVSLDRIQEKSFFNFLWRSVAEGLKKILI